MARCCSDPRNLSATYDKGYTSCRVCHRRYFLTERGWQANPRCEPGRYAR